MAALLERDHELDALGRSAEAARAGRGAVAVVLGDPGYGKSRLLAAAAAAGEAAGLRVITARGSEIEGGYAYGVVRQLLERAVMEDPSLLAGAAAAAAAVLDPLAEADGSDDETDPGFARLRALHLVCLRLSAVSPLLFVVDDAHWADPASLRFLAFLGRRLEESALGLVLAMRQHGDPQRQPLLEALLDEPAAELLTLSPLSAEGVAGLLQPGADPTFVETCHTLTRGVPFLMEHLLREADRASIRPLSQDAPRLQTLGSQSVARSVLTRARRAGPEAVEAMRWLAVLQEAPGPEAIAAVAGIDTAQASAALDSLFREGIVTDGAPTQFVHSIVRGAVYADIPPSERSRRHAQAARDLARGGAPAERTAAHALLATPTGDPGTVRSLRELADRALVMGAPDAAVTYLRRALSEPPPVEERAGLLRDLARAEARIGDPATGTHLVAAYHEARDVGLRISVAVELAATLMATGQYEPVVDLVMPLADGLAAARPDLAVRIEAALVGSARFTVAFADILDTRGPGIDRLLEDPALRASPAGRSLLAAKAFDGAWAGRPATDVAALALEALGDQQLAWDMSRDVSFGMAVHALLMCDELEAAGRHLDWAMERCRSRGSAAGLAWLSFFRFYVRRMLGRLEDAESDARIGVETAELASVPGWTGAALSFLIGVLLERGDVDGAREAYGAMLANKSLVDVPIVSVEMLRGEAAMLAADGHADAALACLDELEAVEASWRVSNTAGYSERRGVKSRILSGLGRHEEALALADDEVATARAIGLTTRLSRALRARAAVGRPAERLDLLHEAAAAAEAGDSPLETAWARFELGAAIRRDGADTRAREILSLALADAERCGAAPLVARIRDELVAAGARPRRAQRVGPDALTASESRVAKLAAGGRSNAEIAAELVVTRKTVEMHLGRVYRKLGIGSRTQLEQALGA